MSGKNRKRLIPGTPEYARHQQANARHYARNRERYRVNRRRWYEANKDRVREKGREYHIRRKFGLTPADVADLLERQGKRCGLCGGPFETIGKHRLVIDHDHETGAVRGALHYSCNVMLGIGGDRPEVFEAAIAYLKRSRDV